tara:strand:- start:221 stop:367 length:147 start_codon:yes stop_codon:yes gene_type:complete
MIKNIKKIQKDISKKRATKATNGLQLILNGLNLFKKGLKLFLSEVFSR